MSYAYSTKLCPVNPMLSLLFFEWEAGVAIGTGPWLQVLFLFFLSIVLTSSVHLLCEPPIIFFSFAVLVMLFKNTFIHTYINNLVQSNWFSTKRFSITMVLHKNVLLWQSTLPRHWQLNAYQCNCLQTHKSHNYDLWETYEKRCQRQFERVTVRQEERVS